MKTNTFPSPWDLRYFQEVARTENLSRAAERLGVAQPTLSLSLKRLEKMLHSQLFHRRSNGLKLTSAGQRLLNECNRLLADWENVVAEARKSQSELGGRFSLGCHPSVALYTLDPLLFDIYSRYPKIEIQLVHGLSRVICERVISGETDFGIVVNPVRHPNLVLHKLATDEVCFWRAPKALDDVLLYDPQLIQSQSILRAMKKKPFLRSLTSDNLEVLTMMTRSGLGIGILPTRVAHTLAPELKKVPDFPSYNDEISFIYRSDIQKTASVKALIERFKKLSI